MKELLKHWTNVFYTDLISLILAIIGLIISLWKRKQNPKLTPLLFLFVGYLFSQFLAILSTITNVYKTSWQYGIHNYSDFLDTIVEFLAVYFCIKNHLINEEIKKSARPLLSAFIISSLVYFIYYKIINVEIDQYFLQVIFTIQASLLIIACVLYYIDLFKKEPKLILTALPSFWAFTGVAFFMLCTLPFSIFGLYLVKGNYMLYGQLFSVFNIFYCILFIMIIKAYLCKPVTVE